jgi:Cys-tRNA(Pro)/Cys-tRNA(Cys) deacylase
VAGRGTAATIALERAKIPFTLHEYTHDPRHESYGLEASEALGVPPEQVFKTLVAATRGSLAVGVVPVHRQLDLKALAAAAGGKRAVMAEIAAAERATGYVAGGISPVGQKRRLPVVIDSSALGLRTLFCSAGRRGLEIELAPADLIRAAGAKVAAIAAPFLFVRTDGGDSLGVPRRLPGAVFRRHRRWLALGVRLSGAVRLGGTHHDRPVRPSLH